MSATRMCWGVGAVATLNMEVRVGLAKKVTLSEDLKGRRVLA